MKVSDLLPFVEQPREKPACAACQTFKPECLVPNDGGGALAMCWLCAHHVVEHGTPVDQAFSAECECLPSEIYPSHILTARVMA